MINEYYYYGNQTPALAFIAGWFNGAVYTPYYSFPCGTFEQGNCISTDAFYLGENNEISLVDAMKNRMRGNWFGSYTGEETYDENKIIDTLDFEVELITENIEDLLESCLKFMMREENRHEAVTKRAEFENIAYALKHDILYDENPKIYRITDFTDASAFERCYQYIHFFTYFIVGNEYAVMLSIGNSE